MMVMPDEMEAGPGSGRIKAEMHGPCHPLLRIGGLAGIPAELHSLSVVIPGPPISGLPEIGIFNAQVG